jgi:adenosylhomocysteinase
MSASFTNQVLAQLELWQQPASYEKQVYMLPKQLDEEVARLHLEQARRAAHALTPKQAEYIGVPVEGPYKPSTTATERVPLDQQRKTIARR